MMATPATMCCINRSRRRSKTLLSIYPLCQKDRESRRRSRQLRNHPDLQNKAPIVPHISKTGQGPVCSQPTRSIRRFFVVLFIVNVPALMILGVMDMTLFRRAHTTIGTHARLFAIYACLSTLEAGGFLAGKRTG